MPESYTITLSAADLDIIGIALGEVPLKQSMPVWMSLKAQTEAAQAATAAKPVETKEETDVSNNSTDNTAS
jgi:hypothetical protein